MNAMTSFELSGSPPPWSVTAVDKFILSAFRRLQREGGDLPTRFHLTLCPWGERNAIGGMPLELRGITHPRLRLVHFTGCSRPYLLAIFTGEDAVADQRIAMRHLPWSEHYDVELRDGVIMMDFLAETEETDGENQQQAATRTLQELFRNGELTEL